MRQANIPAWKKKRIAELRFKLIVIPIIAVMELMGIAGFALGIMRVSADETEGLTAGFSEYAIDLTMNPEAIPEETGTEEEAPEIVQTWTEEDQYLLAKVMFCEGGLVCNDTTLSYIGSVVVNRAHYGKYFPSTIAEVIAQPNQYATYTNGYWQTYEPDDRCMEIAEEILTHYDETGETFLPANVIYQSNYKNLGDGIYLEAEGLYFSYVNE